MASGLITWAHHNPAMENSTYLHDSPEPSAATQKPFGPRVHWVLWALPKAIPPVHWHMGCSLNGLHPQSPALLHSSPAGHV
jgi:hypothetical protein